MSKRKLTLRVMGETTDSTDGYNLAGGKTSVEPNGKRKVTRRRKKQSNEHYITVKV
jgi:hypothetical protein